jgi:hypothetical protein
MKKAEAIRPDFFAKIPSLAKDKEAEKKGATKEERLLYGMSGTAGWRVLRQFIDEVLEDLDKLNEKAIEQGADFEEIGKNTLVVSMAKGVIERIVNKVEDAKESIDGEK